MIRRYLVTAAAFVAALGLAAAPASAAPIAYVNAPMDTPNSAVNTLIGTLNTTLPSAATPVTCSGTTTATCAGLKIVASVTGLTTAAGVTSAAMAVTNTSVAANSIVFCETLGYGGTGNPRATNVVPTASTITFLIQNTHASAALNATVPVACMVYN